MYTDIGCHGKVAVGVLPDDVRRQLETEECDWLEYDGGTGAISVRHIQPTGGPVLPTVVSELVHMLAAVPFELQESITGGEFLVHTEDLGRLVRIRVNPGGNLHVEWAHPTYAGAQRRPYDGHEIDIEAYEQRLNGRIMLRTAEPGQTAAELQRLADTFEGLYPEGDFAAEPQGENGDLVVSLRDVNLDVAQLIDALQLVAAPRSLDGRLRLGSFSEAMPEHMLRFVFEQGEIWVQRPLLWAHPSA